MNIFIDINVFKNLRVVAWLAGDIKGLGEHNSMSELHRVAAEGSLQRVKELIARGVDVNARDEDGFTPLHWAVALGHHEVAGFLIEKGADIHAKDKHGRTPLHNAALFGQLEVARLLVEKGADINARDDAGRTPLHYAAFNGQFEVARFLLKAGANPTVRSDSGKTPSDLARRKGHRELAELIDSWSKRAQELEELPADLIASIEVGSLIEGEWGILLVKLNARSTLTAEGDIEWTVSYEGENMTELRVRPRRAGRLPLVVTARRSGKEERKTIFVDVLSKGEIEELMCRLEIVEREVRKYQEYLEKLEQIREKGSVSERVYQVLKGDYSSKMKKYEAELELLKEKLKKSKI